MGQILCQVRLPARSNFPEDDAMNTFAFTGVAPVETQAELALERLREFYNDTAPTAAEPLKNYLAGTHNPAGMRIKVYDHDDPEPRAPILDEGLGVSTADPVSDTNLPAEVALALSYAGAPESGQSQARRRGRIFLGPLNNGAGSGNSSIVYRPTSAFVVSCIQACKRLAAVEPIGAQWRVYSRANQDFVLIDRGWVDNAFDTQRRRGPAAQACNAWQSEL